MESLQKYTSFTYKRSLTTDGLIILLDEPMGDEVRTGLKALRTVDNREVIFLEDRLLTADLEEILVGITEREQEVLLVFPGNGSDYPRKLSRVCREFPGTGVFAKRFWQPGVDPIVMVGSIPGPFINTSVRTIVVVDDVISSGLTLRRVYQRNAWRFTRAKWIGASWVSQTPRTKAKSGIKGYEYVATACVVGRSDGGKVPINSISSLRQEREVARSYAQRHFESPETFLRLTANL